VRFESKGFTAWSHGKSGVRDSDPQKYPTPSIAVGDETEYRSRTAVVEQPRGLPVAVVEVNFDEIQRDGNPISVPR
jgi:hypothetical protein